MISTSTRYQLVTKDLARTKSQIEKDPVTKREIEYYQTNIKTIKTIDDFIKNDRIFKFAMKAYGLEDMSYAKGLIKKLLQEGVSDRLSMANKMSNPLYKEFAKAFDFKGKGAMQRLPPVPRARRCRNTFKSPSRKRRASRTRASSSPCISSARLHP